MSSFEDTLERGALELYEPLTAELTDADKRSLLAIQREVRTRGSYVYVEIGSHLGGSLQPHLRDPLCDVMYSIDPRPAIQKDSRGSRFAYPDNSTQRMLDGLAAIDASRVGRVVPFEKDASDVDLGDQPKANLAFIDGEHTDAAALSDARACLGLLAENGVVVFHDAPIVYNAIATFVAELRPSREFCAFALPDNLFVVAFDASQELFSSQQYLDESGSAYLQSLQLTNGYRRLRTSVPMRAIFSAANRLGVGARLRRYDYGNAK